MKSYWFWWSLFPFQTLYILKMLYPMDFAARYLSEHALILFSMGFNQQCVLLPYVIIRFGKYTLAKVCSTYLLQIVKVIVGCIAPHTYYNVFLFFLSWCCAYWHILVVICIQVITTRYFICLSAYFHSISDSLNLSGHSIQNLIFSLWSYGGHTTSDSDFSNPLLECEYLAIWTFCLVLGT